MAALRMTWSAGALLRGKIRRAVERFCDWNKIPYTLKEYKGFPVSDYLLTAEGTDGQVRHLEAFLGDIFADIAERNAS